MIRELRAALVLFLFLTVLTGGIYPLAVTGIAQTIFPDQSNGSLIRVGGNAVGSALIGQEFTDPGYFWSRPSATTPFQYNSGASSGSNYGPLNPALRQVVERRISALEAADPTNPLPIPVDLVTASASGLDPDISVAAALYQVPRVARARGLSEQEVRDLVESHIENRQLGFLGEPRVNVLELNLDLDGR